MAHIRAPTVAAGPGVPSAPRSAPLVGRDRELVAIASAWRDAVPDGRVVLLEGEAGIGKTRLAETVATTVPLYTSLPPTVIAI